MRTKRAVFQISDFKAVDNTRSFTCYGNVKNVVDHARDRVIDGAYRDSIAAHKAAGTMPKMFWMHNPWDLPIGTWTEMEEDSKGLLMTGVFASPPSRSFSFSAFRSLNCLTKAVISVAVSSFFCFRAM